MVLILCHSQIEVNSSGVSSGWKIFLEKILSFGFNSPPIDAQEGVYELVTVHIHMELVYHKRVHENMLMLLNYLTHDFRCISGLSWAGLSKDIAAKVNILSVWL